LGEVTEAKQMLEKLKRAGGDSYGRPGLLISVLAIDRAIGATDPTIERQLKEIELREKASEKKGKDQMRG